MQLNFTNNNQANHANLLKSMVFTEENESFCHISLITNENRVLGEITQNNPSLIDLLNYWCNPLNIYIWSLLE